jgi:hypothetical protein
MSQSIASMAAKITVNAEGVTGTIQGVRDKVMSLVSGVRGSATGLLGMGASLASKITSLPSLIAGGSFVGAASFGVKLAADMESAMVSMTVLTKDAQKARDLMQQLKQYAVMSPAFELDELIQVTGVLLAADTPVKNILGTIHTLGTIAAATNNPLGELAALLAEIKVKGSLKGDDLKQFYVRRIPISDELAKVKNVRPQQIPGMVSEGKIGYSDVAQALANMTREGGRFSGLMEQQADTFWGKWANAMESAKMSLMEIGAAIIEQFDLKSVLDGLSQVATMLQQNPQKVKEVVSSIKDALLGIAKAVAYSLAWVIDEVNLLIKPIKALYDWASTLGTNSTSKSTKTSELATKFWEEQHPLTSGMSDILDKLAKAFEKVGQSAGNATNDIKGMTQAGMDMGAGNEYLIRQAGELTEKLRTPLQVFSMSMRDYRKMLDMGLLTQKQFTLAAGDAWAKVRPQRTEIRAPSFAASGSRELAETMARIQAERAGRNRRPEEIVAEEIRRTRLLEKQQLDELRKIVGKLSIYAEADF